jgi:hypothetical protein
MKKKNRKVYDLRVNFCVFFLVSSIKFFLYFTRNLELFSRVFPHSNDAEVSILSELENTRKHLIDCLQGKFVFPLVGDNSQAVSVLI